MQSKCAAIILFALAIVVSAAASAFAVTVTVGSLSGYTDETIEIPITVDAPVGIAGAAFTILYDTNHLDLITVQSTFFDTFTHQWAALNPAPEPYPPDSVVVDSQTYHQPLVYNNVSNTGTLVAAARCTPETNAANTTLFTLTFALKVNAPERSYPISIIPTTLNNTAAGYDAGGEKIAMLIGADPSKDPTDPAAFPILLGANPPAGSTVPGGATFDDDFDDDNINDKWEKEKIVDADPNDEITTIHHVRPFDDFDGDGASNKQEYKRGTDPADPNDYPSMGLPWLPTLLLDD